MELLQLLESRGGMVSEYIKRDAAVNAILSEPTEWLPADIMTFAPTAKERTVMTNK